MKVTLGIEHHAPQVVEKKKEIMKEADIIIPEMSYEVFEKGVMKVENDEERRKVSEEESDDPKTLFKTLKLLKELYEEGKGISPVYGMRIAFDKIKEEDPETAKSIEKNETTYGQLADHIQKGDKLRTETVKEILQKPEVQDKHVYIEVGALHLPFCENIKKYAEENNIEFEEINLLKQELEEIMGFEKEIKNEDTYTPEQKIRKLFIMDKADSEDSKEKIQEYAEEMKSFNVNERAEELEEKKDLHPEEAYHEAKVQLLSEKIRKKSKR